jgi:hypothetical protein
MADTEEKALKCFVLMPSGVGKEYHFNEPQANHVYDGIIVPGIAKAADLLGRKISLDREVDSTLPGAITRAIVTKIANSDIVIADITGRNPNVFLELGIRYSLAKRVTILMNEEANEMGGSRSNVPFDIQNYRYVRYHPFIQEAAKELLSSTIVQAVGAPRDHSDSLVYEYIPNLEVNHSVSDAMPGQYTGKKLRTSRNA